jgi:hypothetical protein
MHLCPSFLGAVFSVWAGLAVDIVSVVPHRTHMPDKIQYGYDGKITALIV